ncbi:MAG: ECF transporter S component [Ruminococcaceae bacterium]|nr:ECF transporter S component [Oscillospiraceae bacterium]
MKRSATQKIIKMVQLALLVALVFVLQMLGSFIKIGPLPMSFVLVPIVVGAFLLGWREGAFLGFVFGVITMVMGIAGIDGFSFLLWQASPFWFIVVCLVKATMAGLGSGLIYKALGKVLGEKYIVVTTVIASISAPIINTGIFVVGMLLFFFDTMSGLPALFPDAFGQFGGAIEVVFLGLAGLNFVGEFVVNLVLSPAIVRIVAVVGKKLKKS